MPWSDKIKENLIIHSKPLSIISAITVLVFTYSVISNNTDKNRFKNIPTPSESYPIVGNIY